MEGGGERLIEGGNWRGGSGGAGLLLSSMGEGSLLAVCAHLASVGCHVHGQSSFIGGGLSLSRVGHCRLWAGHCSYCSLVLGHCW